MYVKLATLLVILSYSCLSFASQSIGEITMLRGEVFKLASKKMEADKTLLNIGDKIHVGETLLTSESSFVRVVMIDQTQISLGPKSKFAFNEFSIKNDIRTTKYEHMYGKVRALVKKKAKENELIEFKQKFVSFSVRGTEFLTNSYQAAGSSVDDFALLKGQGNLDVSKVDPSKGTLKIKPGQAYNTATNKLTQIPADVLKKMLNSADDFLPNLSAAAGGVSDFGKSLAGLGLASAGALALASNLANSDSEDKGNDALEKEKSKDKPETLVKKQKQTTDKNAIKIDKLFAKFPKLKVLEHGPLPGLKDMPEDIRQVYLEREEDLEEDQCYFWFYKRLPGVGEKQRFRRERECVEYDYDL